MESPFDAVQLSIKSRKVIVKGPRGTLRRDFSHMAVDLQKASANQVIVEKWFGTRKELAGVKTVCTHIENMIKGVTKVNLNSFPYYIFSGTYLPFDMLMLTSISNLPKSARKIGFSKFQAFIL